MAHSISTSSTGESPSPVVLKRKRTVRHRTLPPHPTAAAAAASSASSDTNEEEEDMANCLILLAQGQAFPVNEAAAAAPSGPTAAPAGGSDFFLYECKTCYKCFPSFQALGGHRASHKKPKTTASETELTSSATKPVASSSNAGGKQRTHECSVCGSDFPSGQALGGHMRRHRPAVILENNIEASKKKEKRVLLLDLNLPAPNDDDFVAMPLVFPSLVGCHY